MRGCPPPRRSDVSRDRKNSPVTPRGPSAFVEAPGSRWRAVATYVAPTRVGDVLSWQPTAAHDAPRLRASVNRLVHGFSCGGGTPRRDREGDTAADAPEATRVRQDPLACRSDVSRDRKNSPVTPRGPSAFVEAPGSRWRAVATYVAPTRVGDVLSWQPTAARDAPRLRASVNRLLHGFSCGGGTPHRNREENAAADASEATRVRRDPLACRSDVSRDQKNSPVTPPGPSAFVEAPGSRWRAVATYVAPTRVGDVLSWQPTAARDALRLRASVNRLVHGFSCGGGTPHRNREGNAVADASEATRVRRDMLTCRSDVSRDRKNSPVTPRGPSAFVETPGGGRRAVATYVAPTGAGGVS
jgi:hypothetical protein